MIAIRESTEHEKDSWSALTAASHLGLSFVAEPSEANLSKKDPYVVYVSLYGDEFSVHMRRRRSLESYCGGFTCLCMENRAFSVRPLFYLPPGASQEALLKRIVDNLIKAGKEGLAVYEALRRESFGIRVYLYLGVFDFPMAAKFSNSIDAQGTEHCTSCDIVHKETVTEGKGRANSSTVSFNMKDSRYSRTQERTSLIMSVLKNTLRLSTDAVKDALLLNGITDKAGSLMMRLAAAREPGTFDRHEHIIVSPSHLL